MFGVRDRTHLDALFPVWRHHALFTNTTLSTVDGDLIDGPLAHLPSGHFPANAAWALCAAICHNLLPAAGGYHWTALHAATGPPCS